MRQKVDKVNHREEDTGESIVERIHAVMHLFRSRHHQASRGTAEGVTHMESKALAFFAHHPGATPSDLVALSGRDKGQVARMLAGLRERGLLEARVGEADRRTVRLHVTAAGTACHEALQRERRRLAEETVGGLDVFERRQLAALLDRIQANLRGADSTE